VKIVCIARRDSAAPAESFDELGDAEIKQAMQFAVEGFVREIYSIADGSGAVIVAEADSVEAAKAKLDRLPFAQAGLLEIEYVPVKAYRGLAKLAEA